MVRNKTSSDAGDFNMKRVSKLVWAGSPDTSSPASGRYMGGCQNYGPFLGNCEPDAHSEALRIRV